MINYIVAVVVRHRTNRTGGLAGVAADTYSRIDKMLPDGHRHCRWTFSPQFLLRVWGRQLGSSQSRFRTQLEPLYFSGRRLWQIITKFYPTRIFKGREFLSTIVL